MVHPPLIALFEFYTLQDNLAARPKAMLPDGRAGRGIPRSVLCSISSPTRIRRLGIVSGSFFDKWGSRPGGDHCLEVYAKYL